MSWAEQVGGFNARRLTVQYDAFGTTATFRGASLSVCHSSVRSRKQLEDGGFLREHDSLVRVKKASLGSTPLPMERITLGTKLFIVREVVDHPQSGEWLMGIEEA